jgi:HD-GYP domain-containing protein (c-di-GMP phosphodiesterase class II)
MNPLLIVAETRVLDGLPLARHAGDIEVRRVRALPPAASLDDDRPTVILIDRALLAGDGASPHQLAELAQRAALVGWGADGEREPAAGFPTEVLSSFVAADAAPGAVATLLRGAFRHAASLVAEHAAQTGERMRYQELSELTRVGAALSTERNLLTLLEMILSQARRIATADAGSLYLVEKDEEGRPISLRFKLSQNFTLPDLPLTEFTVPIDRTSVSGYAAVRGEPVVIADSYHLPDDVEFQQNRGFDEKFNYRTKSMLVIPMKTHRDEVIGVLQLINRKRDPEVRLSTVEITEREVIPFDVRTVELVNALASQAAVAIENSRLYEDIERLFEGFVTAAVYAIESRDPTTFGHSGRVASLTVGLAEAVDRGGEGPYNRLRFTREQLREIRYAGLLHDFGKVGVREQVLVKQKKLYPADLDVIRHRFAYLMQGLDLEFERKATQTLLAGGRERYDAVRAELDQERAARRAELERYLEAVVRANEPTVLPEGSFEELMKLGERTIVDPDGETRPLLSGEEIRFLTIRKGNLDDQERREIESHVTHTFRFLEQIPWTRELKGIPEIAYGHHEKLNGRGYPRQVGGDQIPVQTRMMTISDIFDALTASDRPYKRALPKERALDILGAEAKEGLLDQHLLRTFIDARVFDVLGGQAAP